MACTIVTQKFLKEILTYNPDSGVFYWKSDRSTRAKAGSIAGTISSHGYIQIVINGTCFFAHRLAFLYMTGKNKYACTDHVNGVRKDNRWVNLRGVTSEENNQNTKIPKDNTIGLMGVYFVKSSRSWQSLITEKGKRKGIYYGKDFFEACCARKSAERRIGFHVNHGRSA